MSPMKKGKKLHKWTVAEKLEVVQAQQQGLSLRELRSMYGVCADTLYKWREGYERNGISGLEQSSGRYYSGMSSAKVEAAEQLLEEVTQKEPEAGIGKVQGALYRHGFLSLARETVRKLLRRKGKGPLLGKRRRRNKPPKVKSFERATPNDLWQTDIMSFMLKGQYRAYLIAYLDDCSRFIVGWGLYRFQSAANVLEVFRAAIEKHGMPKEVLTDNGRQYYTWRGKSKFTVMLTKLGIRHIRSRPYHPQTLGKIESFWRNLLQECLTQVPLGSFEEARDKIGEYVEYYCFKRPHQGIGNVMPSDRFYRVEGQVKQIIEQNTARVEEQKPPLSDYTPPAYLVGNLGGKELRVVAKHAEVSLKEAEEEMVESGSEGNKESFGGTPGALQGEKVEPGSNGGRFFKKLEAGNAGTIENQAAQPSGEAGTDSSGAGEAAVGEESVPTGGSVEGAVLPVDKAGEAGRTGGIGGEGAGSQGGQPEESETSTGQAQGAGPETGKGNGEAAQGEGSSESGGEGGAEDNPPAGVGPVS